MKMDQIPESQIRERASELCKKAGHPKSGEKEFWRQAKEELVSEDDSDQSDTG